MPLFITFFFFLTSAGKFVNDAQTMIDSCLFHKINSTNRFHWHICSTKQYPRPSTTTAHCTCYYSLNSEIGSCGKPCCPRPQHCTVKLVTSKEFCSDAIQIFTKQSNGVNSSHASAFFPHFQPFLNQEDHQKKLFSQEFTDFF